MNGLWQDIQYGVRMLLKRPGATAVAVVTLSLGVGLNTAMYSFMSHVMMSNFKYKDLDTLVIVQSQNPEQSESRVGLSALDFRDLREQNEVFIDMGTFRDNRFVLGETDQLRTVHGQRATTNMFSVLGVPALLGRTFGEDEGRRGNDNTVILSEVFWDRRFGRDPGILGKRIRLNTRSYTIVGVMPKGFWKNVEVWVPMVFSDQEMSAFSRQTRNLRVWARLKPGVSVEQAEAQLQTIAGRLAQGYPETNEGWETHLLTPKEIMAGQLNLGSFFLFLPPGFILLIACANVAHMQLTRAAERRREVALRAALGAGRFRIVRQLLSESVMIALLGGGLALFVAYAGLQVFTSYMPELSMGAFEIDTGALLFLLAVSCLSGMLVGLIPALQSSKVDLNEVIKEGTTKTSSRGSPRLRQVLIVSEVALTTLLVVQTGALYSITGRAGFQDMGFNPKNLLKVSVPLREARFETPDARRAFHDAALARIESRPGVESVALAAGLPLTPAENRVLHRVGDSSEAESKQFVSYRPVSDNYFSTLEVPLRLGRTFGGQDSAGSAPVVIVNETLARQYFPNKTALGERVTLAQAANPFLPPAMRRTETGPPEPREIVGVVADVKQLPIDIFPQAPMAYVPYRQDPSQLVSIAVRSTASPETAASVVVDVLLSLAPELRIGSIEEMQHQIDRFVGQLRFWPRLFTLFAVLGLAMAGIGIYGTTAYWVTQRTREFGIRMALGARGRDITQMVVRKGVVLTALGLCLGALGGYAMQLVMLAFWEVPTGVPKPRELTSMEAAAPWIITIVLLAGVGVLASYLPARRATRVDPVDALRAE